MPPAPPACCDGRQQRGREASGPVQLQPPGDHCITAGIVPSARSGKASLGVHGQADSCFSKCPLLLCVTCMWRCACERGEREFSVRWRGSVMDAMHAHQRVRMKQVNHLLVHTCMVLHGAQVCLLLAVPPPQLRLHKCLRLEHGSSRGCACAGQQVHQTRGRLKTGTAAQVRVHAQGNRHAGPAPPPRPPTGWAGGTGGGLKTGPAALEDARCRATGSAGPGSSRRPPPRQAPRTPRCDMRGRGVTGRRRSAVPASKKAPRRPGWLGARGATGRTASDACAHLAMSASSKRAHALHIFSSNFFLPIKRQGLHCAWSVYWAYRFKCMSSTKKVIKGLHCH